ncbi:MAG: VOC family protein [Rhodobacteraceae bacterium]|nr:VOC family protein [Paracoccaceae bacterium]
MSQNTASLVPELEVTGAALSLDFYTRILGFQIVYQRPEEGFAYLRLGTAELMLDQYSLGRTFDTGTTPMTRPFGRGVNLQIRVPQVSPIIAALTAANHPLYLPLEDRWYRKDTVEVGNRQFIVADPDGYLLRFYQDLGQRPCQPG